MRLRPVLLVAAVAAAVAVTGSPAAAAPTTVLHADGIGPLHLQMKRSEALATGWLAGRSTGCPLGGPPLPITYRLTGAQAPDGVLATAEFAAHRLTTLSFTRGVRTSLGVSVGHTTAARMVARYRKAGFIASARYDDTFRGTFVAVKRGGRQVLGGFADGRHGSPVTILGIPFVPVCE